MRHALAQGTGDPAGFVLDDCSTQRNLNSEGQQQALRWGKLLRRQIYSFTAANGAAASIPPG
jgi:phosphohistidine phosphatase SixA